MHRANNYDSKSSIFSGDYKIPYESSENSRIVEHLEQSQEELEFLKYKLTEVYQKLEIQIKSSISLQASNDYYMNEMKKLQQKMKEKELENSRLKELMQTIIQNRKVLEEEVQYTHKRYKKLLMQQEQESEQKMQQLQKQVIKLKKQVQFLEQQLSVSANPPKNNDYEQQIAILQNQIKKISTEKVVQVSRLRHEIQSYQRSLSPIKQFQGVHSRTTNQETIIHQSNKQNAMLQISTIQVENTQDSNFQEQSIGKWKRSKANQKPIIIDKPVSISKIKGTKCEKNKLTDDQKLTKCQIEKKNLENKLFKIQRLKRHTADDRSIMEELQKKIYQMDSQISGLKRKIRQKY